MFLSSFLLDNVVVVQERSEFLPGRYNVRSGVGKRFERGGESGWRSASVCVALEQKRD